MAADSPGDPSTLFSVAGKSVLVTGGSRGVGYNIARGFLSAGATVTITARKADACKAAAEELSAIGSCTAVPGDVSTSEGIAALVEALASTHQSLDVLVNNAGAAWGVPLEEYPRDAWDKVLDVNVKGVFELTVGLLPLLRAAASADDPARVVNIGSVEGIQVPVLENYAYPASKAAVHMLTRHLALRLAGEHITVNAIAPGPFDSKMMAFVLDDPAGRESVRSHVPLGRVGRPDDLAGAALFLTSRAGAYLTGVILPVDGGITAR
ncbi:SDR family oxidoreductase [Acidiferrimicrobium sp. IK]|uniref:SDR family oxidoreductase n=1 Tax=Acidiferrimicrobium sp. IK TaxID=2871700 RepID=UPI0021CAF204|nr:SDR family oxidoreductase [Acidiferrimicrobium sp. IK]MCU4187440.1 SDR family oxidoreductase [Acidiferrimicrobium sp. IK]